MISIRDEYRIEQFALLRTPALSFDTVIEWGSHLHAAEANAADLAAAVERDRQFLLGRVRDRVSDPLVRSATAVASPSLDEALEAWVRTEQTPPDAVVLAVLRYLYRMSSRATPFGMFAGVSLATAGARTELVIAGRDSFRTVSQADMSVLNDVMRRVARNSASRHVQAR